MSPRSARSALPLVLIGLVGCGLPQGVPDESSDAGITRGWNPNEVSILFPLVADPSRLLGMQHVTDAGVQVLLEESLFRRLGDGVSGLPRLIEAAGYSNVYPDLRVVSARIDPCFDGPSPHDASCRRQIRLVAQVIEPSTAEVSDAAIHLFYELDEPRFLEVLSRLRALSRSAAPSGQLRVHPVLDRERLVGPHSDEMRAIILSSCSSATLTRFTFMATGRSKNWHFFAFDRQPGGDLAQSTVHGVGDSDSFTDQGSVGYRTGVALNVPWFPDELLTSSATRALELPAFEKAYDRLARLANPLLTKTEEVSCAACHASSSTQFEVLSDRGASTPPPTPSSYALRAKPSLQMGNMHAFSYFFGTPTVSERTVNETDEILRRLQSADFLSGLTAAQRERLK